MRQTVIVAKLPQRGPEAEPLMVMGSLSEALHKEDDIHNLRDVLHTVPYCCAMPYLKSMNYLSFQYVKNTWGMQLHAVRAGLARFKMLNCCLQWFKVSLRTLDTADCCLPHLFTTAIRYVRYQWSAVVKVVLWSRGGGAYLTKSGWSKPHTHSNPTNSALFRQGRINQCSNMFGRTGAPTL